MSGHDGHKIADGYSERQARLLEYCNKVSLRQDPLLKELIESTLGKSETPYLLGDSEVYQLGQNLIQLTKGKKALDVGTFTGASALAWALALPEDGRVLAMDITDESYKKFGEPIISRRKDISDKITLTLGSAIDTLDSLLAAGEAGTWDFAFIDADKQNYPIYYKKCVELLRPGGVILIDDSLWQGKVMDEVKDTSAAAIDECNRIIQKDQRVVNILLNIGDGTQVVFKK